MSDRFTQCNKNWLPLPGSPEPARVRTRPGPRASLPRTPHAGPAPPSSAPSALPGRELGGRTPARGSFHLPFSEGTRTKPPALARPCSEAHATPSAAPERGAGQDWWESALKPSLGAGRDPPCPVSPRCAEGSVEPRAGLPALTMGPAPRSRVGSALPRPRLVCWG